MKKTKGAEKITLPKMDRRRVSMTIVGDGSMVVHNWDEKARQMMRDKQMGKATGKLEPKNPEECYLASLYHTTEGGTGFPVSGLKKAAVSACRYVDGIDMIYARGAFYIHPNAEEDSLSHRELIVIDGQHRMREDMVRLNGRTADLRYRAEYTEWRATFDVDFDATVITAEQIVNLFNRAGMSVGLGEGRPEKCDMGWGRFHVATDKEMTDG
jgi:hypothetical protein